MTPKTASRSQHLKRSILVIFALIGLVFWIPTRDSAAQTTGLTVSVVMGTHTFSWTFSQPVANGTFVDGQPWIVRPSAGVSLTATTPTRQNGVSVEGLGPTSVVASVDMTVINPPIADYYDPGAVVRVRNAFGWDSRGCIRYGLGGSYDSSLPWDGVTPVPLQVGDVVTTALSRRADIVDTVLEAVAVLTVLDAPPPADAFRPGFTRTAARRANPEWFRLSDLIDLTPYLIPEPHTDLYGHNLPARNTNMSAPRLTSLLPGPSVLNHGVIYSRSSNANYNNSGAAYGGTVGQQMGDVAVGALAGWLTPEERRICQIHLIQRAVDTQGDCI
jgi:hypothetical protein